MALIPCPSCSRHALADEDCPFCGATVTGPVPRRRWATTATRAALFGLGVAIIGCDDPGPAPVYGAPPIPDEPVAPAEEDPPVDGPAVPSEDPEEEPADGTEAGAGEDTAAQEAPAEE